MSPDIRQSKILTIGAMTALVLCGCGAPLPEADELIMKGEERQRAGDLTRAEIFYSQAAASSANTSYPELYELVAKLHLLRCFIRDKKFQEATALISRLRSLSDIVYGAQDPLQLAIMYQLVLAQEGTGQYAQAMSTCEQILKRAESLPGSAPNITMLPLTKMGDLQVEMGNIHSAAELYVRANAYSSGSPFHYLLNYRLARSNILLSRNDEATRYFEKAFRVGVRDAPGIVPLVGHDYAAFLMQTGRKPEADVVARQAEDALQEESSYVRDLKKVEAGYCLQQLIADACVADLYGPFKHALEPQLVPFR